MRKYYRIAGLTVEMDSFGKTASQAEAYAVPLQGDVDIRIDRFPEEFSARYPEASEELCEYMYSGISFYLQLIGFDGIMLHSSAVVVDGVAYLFTASSGVGKSTHTSLYIKRFGDRAFILNDDKPAIRFEDGRFYAYGTPWSGKTDRNVNARAPLGGICVLERGEENEISRIYGKQAILGIFSQTMRPSDAQSIGKVLDLIGILIEKVPVWKLNCNTDPEAAQVSYEAMSNP